MAGLDSELTRDDGLILPVVGVWALKKHKVFGYYSQIFATSMKKKWECRVYLDLFAGAGKARVRGTKKIIAGSPLLSLNAEDPFDRYIFCDKDSQNIDALTRRVGNYFPERNRTFVRGDSNNCVDEILKAIPRYSKGYRVLTLCLVDPYKASDICFETIRGIAQRIIADFLILIPSYMDINRLAVTISSRPVHIWTPILERISGERIGKDRCPGKQILGYSLRTNSVRG